MKKLRNSAAAKVIALIMFCVFSASFVLSAAGAVLLESWGAYTTDSYEEIQVNAIRDMARNRLSYVWDMYSNGFNPDTIYPDSNFRFAVFDADGKELYSNKENEKLLLRVIQTMEPFHIESSEGAAGDQTVILNVYNRITHETVKVAAGAEFEKWKAENSYEVIGYVLKDMEYKDEFYDRLELLDALIPYDYALIFCAGGSALLLLLLLVFLLSSAGHRKDSEEINLNFVDKIPLDVFLVFATALVFLPITIVSELDLQWNIVGYIAVGTVTAYMALAMIVSLMSIAVRIKSGTFWTNCLCVRLCFWCLNTAKRILGFIRTVFCSFPLNKRWILSMVLVLGAEFFLMLISRFNEAMMLLLWLLNCVLTIAFFSWCIYCFMKLSKGAKELASGSLACSIETKYMRAELKEHAEDLMNIREGMTRAVNERMKSERFQSELITNVSHDIKTPLTSIVNYVDLLAKEELNNEKAEEYVEVLSRQSAKLKKLIGDLIEASKASTGVLAVNPEKCELGVLLDQCAGEYSERMQNAGLKLLLTKPEESIKIMADGRHMWRILDNLMGNVLKYAQSGTRVYLGLEREGNKARISLRNISRDELNISGEELMERFVRGDSSRSTEGSGLGLSIAKSLCELQKGQMSLSVDGDLFKVLIEFDTI